MAKLSRIEMEGLIHKCKGCLLTARGIHRKRLIDRVTISNKQLKYLVDNSPIKDVVYGGKKNVKSDNR